MEELADCQNYKKSPLRKCIVCSEFKLKEKLVRLSDKRNAGLFFEKQSGHFSHSKGVYICRSSECIELFLTGRRFKTRYRERMISEDIKKFSDFKQYLL